MKFQPYFTTMASNIGYGWWSHDIGGHMFGYRDEELETRWYQLGTFSPIQPSALDRLPIQRQGAMELPSPAREAMKRTSLRHDSSRTCIR
ncbi:MAG: TIM-barrel domain-containing protein [Bifidobacterium breve]